MGTLLALVVAGALVLVANDASSVVAQWCAPAWLRPLLHRFAAPLLFQSVAWFVRLPTVWVWTVSRCPSTRVATTRKRAAELSARWRNGSYQASCPHESMLNNSALFGQSSSFTGSEI